MKRLLLLAAAFVLFPSTASAQWTFDTVFPADTLDTNANGLQGVAVDDDGTVFLQPLNTTVDSIDVGGTQTGVTGLRIFNPDGTEVDASPLLFIDYADGTTPRDTLGIFSFIDGTGATDTETRTGRGLRYCEAENAVYISQFDTIFKIDADTYEGLAKATPTSGSSLSAVGVDENCNVTATTVFGGNNIVQYDPDLTATTGTVAVGNDFSRTILVSPDGNTVFETDFENPFTIVYQRPDEFSAYDSLGVTWAGLRVESTAINPSTGNYWVSAGNPLNPPNQFNDIDPATGDTLRTSFSQQAWYAYNPADLFDAMGNPVLNPTPVDSILWNNPQNNPNDVNVGPRPRGISFTADGNTAYVVAFNSGTGPNAQRFVRGTVANEGGPGTFAGNLEQNAPNPFSGTTAIKFDLERSAHVTLRVFDTTGRQVALLADGVRAAGPNEVSFDASGLAAGVYVYTLDVEGDVASRRMMIVR